MPQINSFNTEEVFKWLLELNTRTNKFKNYKLKNIIILKSEIYITFSYYIIAIITIIL